MVVGIGPFGVVREYMCQPGSICAVSLAITFAPGVTTECSEERVQRTGSGRWANATCAKKNGRRNFINVLRFKSPSLPIDAPLQIREAGDPSPRGDRVGFLGSAEITSQFRRSGHHRKDRPSEQRRDPESLKYAGHGTWSSVLGC